MRTVAGLVCLLIVLAVIAVTARQQMRTSSDANTAARLGSAASRAGVDSPMEAASGQPGSPRNIEQQFENAAKQALQQGAQRASDAEQ